MGLNRGFDFAWLRRLSYFLFRVDIHFYKWLPPIEPRTYVDSLPD